MSPRDPRTNRRMREAAVDTILESALEIFAEQGLSRASVRDIARRAGVSKGLPYHYFDSKEELLRAALETHLAGLLEVVDGLDECGSPGQQLATLVDGLIARVEERPALFRLYLGLVLRSSDGTLERAGASVREAVDAYLARVEELFAELGSADPEMDAALFRSTLLGLCFRVAAPGRRLPLAALRDRLLETFPGAGGGQGPDR